MFAFFTCNGVRWTPSTSFHSLLKMRFICLLDGDKKYLVCFPHGNHFSRPHTMLLSRHRQCLWLRTCFRNRDHIPVLVFFPMSDCVLFVHCLSVYTAMADLSKLCRPILCQCKCPKVNHTMSGEGLMQTFPQNLPPNYSKSGDARNWIQTELKLSKVLHFLMLPLWSTIVFLH